MTDKRFKDRFYTLGSHIFDNGKELTVDDCEELLNELHEEKEFWKQQCKNELDKNAILTMGIDKNGNLYPIKTDKVTEIKRIIDKSIELERTQLGKSVLKQLKEKIQ